MKKLAETTKSTPKPVPPAPQRETSQGKSEQLSIGIWPQGGGAPSRQPKQEKPDNSGYGDVATDDETSADDNLDRTRNHKAEIIKNLIEGGLAHKEAREFVNMLPDHQSDPHARSATLNAMRALSGYMMKQTGVNIPKPEHFGGGTRN